MFKVVSILFMLISAFLFLRAIFGRTRFMKRAISDLRREIDYLVWIMLVMIGAAIVYSAVVLIEPSWR
ncbi:MAG TPA: hypothetical protein VKW08_27955 [Xanthobacteraceae bacterium]|nr:hypothetical protein [Xanthobacteraceae bacterium]